MTSLALLREGWGPITHLLAGACIARAALNRKTALATLTVVLAAEAPDLERACETKSSHPWIHSRSRVHPLFRRRCLGLGSCNLLHVHDLASQKTQGQASRTALVVAIWFIVPGGAEPYPTRFHGQLRSASALALFRQMEFVGHRLSQTPSLPCSCWEDCCYQCWLG